jgi:hypothetical protein
MCKEWFGQISGYKQKYQETALLLERCNARNEDLFEKNLFYEQQINKLENRFDACDKIADDICAVLKIKGEFLEDKLTNSLKALKAREDKPTVTLVERDAIWMHSILRVKIPDFGSEVIRYPLDGRYWLMNQKDMLDIISWDWTDEREYVLDRYDCDKFAIAFKAMMDWNFEANQVGIVLDYNAGHAYNIIVYPDGNLNLFEPQTDSLMFISDRNKDMYALEDAIILI